MKKYSVNQTIPEERYYEVYINADSNDADYISATEKYSQDEFDEIVEELINLKMNYSGNHQFEEYPNEYDLNLPYSDWGQCHTLEEIRVTMYDTNGFVYSVELESK